MSQSNQQPQLPPPPPPDEKRLTEITKIIEDALAECSIEKIKGLPAMQRAIKLAQGVKTMRSLLKAEVVENFFIPLQNTTLGFLTDKPEGYGGAIVRDCVIEALIRGFQVVGNEFNIISGRAYFTREGFERRVREFPKISNVHHHPMIHTMGSDGKTALVPYRITYKLDGQELEFKKIEEERLQVRVNAGMGPDGIMGKARRKALAALFDQLSGTELATADGDVSDTILTTAEPAGSKQSAALEDLARQQKKPKGEEPYPEPGSRG